MKNPQEEKEHDHQFWKDENPPECLGCGLTKKQIYEKSIRADLLTSLLEEMPYRVNEMTVAEDAKKEGVPKEKIIEIFTYWQGWNHALSDIKQLIKSKL